MSNDINLLVKKDKKLLREQSQLKAFRLIAIGCLLSLLLISLSIFLLNQKLSCTSAEIEKDRESVLTEMKPFREKETKLNVVNNRIDNISKVLNKRTDVYKILNTLLRQVPEGILVDSLGFYEKKVSIEISSSSLIPVDGLINNLVDMAKRKEIIKTLTLDSLDVSESVGSYKVSISMSI